MKFFSEFVAPQINQKLCVLRCPRLLISSPNTAILKFTRELVFRYIRPVYSTDDTKLLYIVINFITNMIRIKLVSEEPLKRNTFLERLSNTSAPGLRRVPKASPPRVCWLRLKFPSHIELREPLLPESIQLL